MDGEDVGRMGGSGSGSGSGGGGSESNGGENGDGGSVGRCQRSRRGPTDGRGDVSGGALGTSCV